jgi:riboflavin kinase/FMN adenylyltransferase
MRYLSIKIQKLNHYFILLYAPLLILQPINEAIMLVHTQLKSLKLVHPVVTTGVFDGVHLGHKALLGHLVKSAKKLNGESVVITFNPPPRLALAENRKNIYFLTTLEEKKRLIEETGVDHLLILNFTRKLGNMSAYDFIKEILAAKIGTEHLVIGYDHHFGKSRKGDYDSVKEYADEFGFGVEKIGEIVSGGEIISSTSIRDALLSGNPDLANKMLGYCYSIGGTVISGKGIGKNIGFPTANIKPGDKNKLIPADGVYAVTVGFEENCYNGVLSIGFNPTVNRDLSKRSIEVNIIDFDGDIYNREIRIYFRFRLRAEKRFDSVGDLVGQMKLDKQLAMKLLAKT